MNTTVLGLNVNYIDQGQGGQTILFLHGWGAPITAYQAIFDLLSPKYRVVACDMPGVGGTDEPREPMTVDDYVAFVLAFCKELQIDEAILMAHSHGGRVALRILAREQARLRCPKAVLIDAAGIVPQRSAGYKARQRLYKMAKVLGTAKLTRPLFGGLYVKMRDKRSSADYKNATPIMRKTLVNVVNTDCRDCMPLVKTPVLLVWGDRDTATPLANGQTMEQLIPGAGLAVIRNAGHFCFADNWPQFAAVLGAFL